ncbi:26S protease regulatory subunit 6A-B [Aspergillus luchuensis]|uniref:26S protease regulatory subunit 6A-B n=1 Tax=Aspergillus kawachii TaxID=1069201 RepID=A0A146FI75_ASPKA|nr:26S protease regulatory subunit 6A-B [Aspergillus luchuensis]
MVHPNLSDLSDKDKDKDRNSGDDGSATTMDYSNSPYNK